MKIAILINTFHEGFGMDNVARLQASELSRAGYDVNIFTFDSSIHDDKFEITQLNWPKKPLLNYTYRLLYPLDLSKNFIFSNKLKGYDVIIAHFYPMTYLAYSAKKRYPNIKYIYYNHGVINTKYNPLLHQVYAYLLIVLSKFTTSNADAVLSISKFTENVTSIPVRAKTSVIYNTVDPTKFNYSYPEICSEIKNLSENTGPLFLYVGVLTRSKGISMLIEAFKKVLHIYPHARLLLAGQISYGFNISKNISKAFSKNILFLGHVPSTTLGFLYNICDVCVSASVWESFNLPLVEAQLLGTPVVAFDVGAHSEVVINRETGILVEPFDTSRFAEAMIKVYENKEIMGAKAKKWAFRFSIRNQESKSISQIIEYI